MEATGTVDAPEARELAARLAGELLAFAQAMFERIAADIPEVHADPETAALTLASCVSTLETAVTMLQHGIPVERTEAPVAALEHTRHMVSRGMSIDATLRFYRLGHVFFWDWWIARLSEEISDPRRLGEVLSESSRWTFAYMDAVSGQVSEEMLAERERRIRRVEALREDLVAEIIAGASVEQARAERTLGFALDRPLLAFTLHTDADSGDLEAAAAALVATLGASRPLLLAHGPDALLGWVAVDKRPPAQAAQLRPVLARAAPAVHVAMGSAASNMEGFRASHEQALRARRIARLSAAAPPTLTIFEEIALVDLLSRDLDYARALVRRELGGLAGGGERNAELRGFLLAHLAAGANQTSLAAQLGIHRNTARQRLARAEALRGAPISGASPELFAALLLADAIGASVLPEH